MVSFFSKKINLKDFNFPKQIEINGNLFNIEVLLVDKKNSSVSVEASLLKFRLSSRLSKLMILSHFNSLLKNIVLKLEKKNYFPQENKNFDFFLEKGNFKFANEIYYFKYLNSRGIKLKENVFYIGLVSRYKILDIKKKVIKLLIKRYTPRLETYLNLLNSSTYNFKIEGFYLNNVKSKWGHCTYDNKIMLNLKLLNAPKQVLDYVIYHELSHIKHKNHSREFWMEVKKFCPNYKNLKRYLKENPPVLFI